MRLKIENISFSYSVGRHLLKNISLSLEEKTVYALMGSNGAGKTTLFNLITGFIKPKIGQIFLDKNNLINRQPYIINRFGISRTFQDLRIITKLTVKDNIILAMKDNPGDLWYNGMLPGYFFKNKNKFLEKKAGELAEEFFLKEVTESMAGEISYGQQKLLTLACCVANGASVLLIDEPVAGIQPEYRNKIAGLIKKLKEQGKIILLIEHNIDFIENIADSIFFLHEGQVASFSDMESLRNDARVTETFI